MPRRAPLRSALGRLAPERSTVGGEDLGFRSNHSFHHSFQAFTPCKRKLSCDWSAKTFPSPYGPSYYHNIRAPRVLYLISCPDKFPMSLRGVRDSFNFLTLFARQEIAENRLAKVQLPKTLRHQGPLYALMSTSGTGLG